MKIKELINRYRDLILYGFFGVCTTLVNMAVYWLCARLLGLAVLPATIIAWFMAVLFAYFTNRRWVFHSAAATRQELWREFVSFYSCRIATGVVDWALMFVFVDLLHMNDIARPDDAADGLAVALTHANSIHAKQLFKIK